MSTIDPSATSATVGEIADEVAKKVLQALIPESVSLNKISQTVWDDAPAGEVLAETVTRLRKGGEAATRGEAFIQNVLAAAPVGILEKDVKVRVKFTEVGGAQDCLVTFARDGKSASTAWVPPKPK
jgi:hypothetical protein